MQQIAMVFRVLLLPSFLYFLWYLSTGQNPVATSLVLLWVVIVAAAAIHTSRQVARLKSFAKAAIHEKGS